MAANHRMRISNLRASCGDYHARAAMLTIRHRAAVDVTQAVRERLGRVRRQHGVDLAERLLLIGRDCAAHLKEPFRTINHEDMLYDDRGLPK